MNRLSPASWLAIGVVALIQTAVLGWMVVNRMSLLSSGREIVVEVSAKVMTGASAGFTLA